MQGTVQRDICFINMKFLIADKSHEESLRKLLRDNPVPGSPELSFEREPDFFHGAGIEGDSHKTVIALDRTGEVAGLAGRTIGKAYVNGRIIRLGYLNQLRISGKYRGAGLLAGGWSMMKKLHEQDPADAYMTTIISGNYMVRRLLEKDRPTKPRYRRKGDLYTLALSPKRFNFVKKPPAGISIQKAHPDMLSGIASCLQRNYARFQFAPFWTEEILRDPGRSRALSSDDFIVALRGNRIVGCAALWDQQSFKQTIVRGYSGLLRLTRPFLNLAPAFSGMPVLPATGSPLPHMFISHAAVDGDDIEIMLSLIDRARLEAKSRKPAYIAMGLSDKSPFLRPVRKKFRHMVYRSVIYLVCWPGDGGGLCEIDERPAHPELAIL